MANRTRLRGKVLRKLLLIPLLLTVPVSILLILISGIQFETSKRQNVTAVDIGLNQAASRIQKETEDVARYLQLRLSNSAEYLRQAERDSLDMSDPGAFRDIQTIIATVEDLRGQYESVSLAFLKFPYMKHYLIRGAEAEASRELLENLDTDALKEGSWLFLQSPGELSVLAVRKSEGAVMGYKMDLYEELNPLLRDYPLVSRCALFPLDKPLEQPSGELVLTADLPSLNTLVLLGIQKRDFNAQVPPAAWILLILSLAAVSIAPLLTIYYYRRIVKPVAELHRTMQEIRDGNTEYRAQLNGDPVKNEFVELADYFNSVIDDLQHARLEMYEKDLKEKNTLLKFYAQQIRPHFMLNALNRIYIHEAQDWPEVKREIMTLARYFRTVINIRHEFVSLQTEMEFVQLYLEIQKFMYDQGELYYVVSWAPELAQLRIPPMILGSFVGNCFKHGLTSGHVACLAVSAEIDKDCALLRISDNGPGFAPDILVILGNINEDPGAGENVGVGISNSLQRLELLYEGRAKVRFYNEGGAVAELRLPLEYMEDEA